jgi:hypothetical protein
MEQDYNLSSREAIEYIYIYIFHGPQGAGKKSKASCAKVLIHLLPPFRVHACNLFCPYDLLFLVFACLSSQYESLFLVLLALFAGDFQSYRLQGLSHGKSALTYIAFF